MCLCLHSLPIQSQMQAHLQFECWCMLAVQQGRVVSLLSDTRVMCNICLHKCKPSVLMRLSIFMQHLKVMSCLPDTSI